MQATVITANHTVQSQALREDLTRVARLYAAAICDFLLLQLQPALWGNEQELRAEISHYTIRGIQRTVNAIIEAHYLAEDRRPHSTTPATGNDTLLAAVEEDAVQQWFRARGVPLPPPLLRAWIIANSCCLSCCSELHVHYGVEDPRWTDCPPEWNPYGACSDARKRTEIINGTRGMEGVTLADDLLDHFPSLFWFHAPAHNPDEATSIFQSFSNRSMMTVELLAAVLDSTIHTAADLYNEVVVSRLAHARTDHDISREDLVWAANTIARIGFSDASKPLYLRPWVPVPGMQPREEPAAAGEEDVVDRVFVPGGMSHATTMARRLMRDREDAGGIVIVPHPMRHELRVIRKPSQQLLQQTDVTVLLPPQPPPERDLLSY